MALEKFTISRDDSVYECFPHLCLTRSGRILLVYRESNGHVASDFCRLVLRRSDDAGRTWSERFVLRDEVYENGILTKWNCPKIQQLRDGRILLLCDRIDFPPGEWNATAGNARIVLWFSGDDGATWSDGFATSVNGICPDIVTELADGTWLLPANTYADGMRRVVQNVSASADRGRTWGPPLDICPDPDYRLAEASVVACPGGELVVYLREESGRGRPLQKMISRDRGRSFEGPFDTLNPAAHGMPVSGVTRDGLVLTLGRFNLRSGWRVDMSAETVRRRLERRTIVVPNVPENADFRSRLKPGPGTRIDEREIVIAGGGSPPHTFAFLEPLASALEADLDRQDGLLLHLDHDRNNISCDSGYTGWVEYERGRFLAANYINDDAPMAQIRGYRFSVEDF